MAASLGAVGALIFPDPHSFRPNDTYPNTRWTSGDAVFERPITTNLGDPLTPEIPSIDGMYRGPRNMTAFGAIPSQPISYNDALMLLNLLQGERNGVYLSDQHGLSTDKAEYRLFPFLFVVKFSYYKKTVYRIAFQTKKIISKSSKQ